MTPREALDRIAALDAEGIIQERSLAEGAQRLYAIQVAEVTLSVVRGVLAEVSPEPGGDMQSFGPRTCISGGVLDRDALTPEAGTATFDDALRDVDDLARVLYEVRESGGWDRALWADRNYWRGMAAKAIAAGWRRALVRPVAGVTLTTGSEQARVVQWALRRAVEHAGSDDVRATAVAIDRAIGEAAS